MENEIMMTQELFDEAMDRAETMEDVLKVMQQTLGAEVTEQDLEQFAGIDENGELAEEALDDVAGGGWVTRLMLRQSQIMLRHARMRVARTIARINYRRRFR